MNDLVLLSSDNSIFMENLKVAYFYDMATAEKYKIAFRLTEYYPVKFQDLSEDRRKILSDEINLFKVVFVAMVRSNGHAVCLNCDGLKALLEAQSMRASVNQ